MNTEGHSTPAPGPDGEGGDALILAGLLVVWVLLVLALGA